MSRHPLAEEAAAKAGNAYERLLEVCRVMALEPWNDMVGAPMAGDFYDVCERLDPAIAAHHRDVARRCLATILEDDAAAEVFLLALDGLFADNPAPAVLEQRVQLLAARFAAPGKGAQ